MLRYRFLTNQMRIWNTRDMPGKCQGIHTTFGALIATHIGARGVAPNERWKPDVSNGTFRRLGAISRSETGGGEFSPEAQTRDIQVINEHIDHTDCTIFFKLIVESLGKQRDLAAIPALDELAHGAITGWKAQS